ncbi:hypothetical protein [Rhizobium sp. RCAM05973]|nr:hypothetical protein [Rhizobium sp. RCAM05973]
MNTFRYLNFHAAVELAWLYPALNRWLRKILGRHLRAAITDKRR